MSEKKKPEEFEAEVRAVWGDSVELLTPYTRCTDKVLVLFKECGHQCWKSPNKLLSGQGCGVKECHYGLLSRNKTRSSEQFLADLTANGYRYELLSEFTGVKNNVTVKNLGCGHIYSAKAGNILRGSGCPVCHGMKDTETFKRILEEKYPGEYTVLGEYINNRTEILTRHNKCGYEWDVTPKTLLRHFTCPYCNKSLGEHLIQEFLDQHGLEYQCQYTFEDCRDEKKLPFDFAVFINGEIRLIEFDGSQHFDGHSRQWNTPEHHSKVAMHDTYKNVYCAFHRIPLLRIPYWRIHSFDKMLASFLDIQL